MEKINIRFQAQNKPEFISSLRDKVDHYFETNNISKYGNMNLAFKSVFMFSLYLVPYFLMITGVINSLAGVFICWAIIGLGKAGVGMAVMHDANHHSYSKNKTTNKWMAKTMYLLGGFPPNWQYQHNTLHHGYTNIDGVDEDIDPGSVIRLSPHKPLLRAHKYQHIYAWFLYGLMTLSWVTTKDYAQLKRYINRGAQLVNNRTNNQLFITLIVSKIIYFGFFLLIPMVVLPFAWYWIILFFITMHFVSGFILTIIFQTAHVVTTSDYPLPDKDGSIYNNWAIHQMKTTSDYSPNNKIFSWFIGGLNYQVEHHLFPNISHVHYSKISNLVKETAHQYGIPYYVQSGFLNALWEHAKMLKKLGQPYPI